MPAAPAAAAAASAEPLALPAEVAAAAGAAAEAEQWPKRLLAIDDALQAVIGETVPAARRGSSAAPRS